MEKCYSAAVFMTLVVLVSLIARCIKARVDLYHARADLLRKKWNTARERRFLWKDEHMSCFNFDDPEYQRLWDIEIGAEDLYLLYISITCHSPGISWRDYTYEREESEPQEN